MGRRRLCRGVPTDPDVVGLRHLGGVLVPVGATTQARPAPVRPPSDAVAPRWFAAVAAAVAAVAFLSRLVPVLRGGGLRGLGNYDDGVYYTAAVALLHGQLPYRDFLFLHPPGILVALAPFAAVAHLTSDSTGMVWARLAVMALGAVSAVLVVRILRWSGAFPAALGGLFYAVYWPNVTDERTTLLEGPGSLCLLAALALLAGAPGSAPAVLPTVLAGAALGLACGLKIWGLAVLATVALMVLVAHGARPALRVLGGAALALGAVCLPFWLAAPAAMFRLVVRDQLGRHRYALNLGQRLSDMVGVPPTGSPDHRLTLLVVVALLVVLGSALLAWRVRRARTAVALLAVLSAVLLTSPSWYMHYAALIAAPLALTLGFAAGRLFRLLPAGAGTAGRALAASSLVAVLAYCWAGLSTEIGVRFPGTELAAAAGVRGCVTADDPSVLVQMNVLSRDYHRGCRVEVDVTGAIIELQHGRHSGGELLTAQDRARWQPHLRGYLLSGSATMLVRRGPDELTHGTRAQLRRLPVLARHGSFVLLGTARR